MGGEIVGMMSESQILDRDERVAIMVTMGGVTEEEAHRFCDSRPDMYGIREVTERQNDLF